MIASLVVVYSNRKLIEANRTNAEAIENIKQATLLHENAITRLSADFKDLKDEDSIIRFLLLSLIKEYHIDEENYEQAAIVQKILQDMAIKIKPVEKL
ncbi:MAG TPA: hypothetical protein PLY70_00655 [Saprospiraceae bacterium]|nr:hypothetical protein [Saprospiraceae bacterium]HPN71864.1 hypothetical protein [Saprospiraceae bacterium]